MDYELAIHNAVAAAWPSTTGRGCNFHYKKGLLKHVKQTNIWVEYLTPNVPRIWRHLKPFLIIEQALTDVKKTKRDRLGGNYLSHVHQNGSVIIDNFGEL